MNVHWRARWCQAAVSLERRIYAPPLYVSSLPEAHHNWGSVDTFEFDALKNVAMDYFTECLYQSTSDYIKSKHHNEIVYSFKRMIQPYATSQLFGLQGNNCLLIILVFIFV